MKHRTLTACLVCSVALLAPRIPSTFATETDSTVLRTWTDATGKFQVEAELIGVADGTAKLRKKDGQVIGVPVDKLCQDDAAFLRDMKGSSSTLPKVGVGTAEGLESLARRQQTAKRALGLYSLFLADTSSPVREKELAKERLGYWANAAEDDLQHVGSKWVTPAGLKEIQSEEAKLFDEAMELFLIKSYELAEEKFIAAAKINPRGIRADFRVGILLALFRRDAEKAGKYFDKCVKRRESRLEELTLSQSANLIASLNNLAVTEVRQRRISSAIRHWERTLEIGPPSREVIQNLGRLEYLSRQDVRNRIGGSAALTLNSREKERWKEIYSTSMRINASRVFDSNSGWLYIPFVPEEDASEESDANLPARVIDSEGAASTQLRYVGSGSGFAVAPNYILTNAHVARDADAFRIVEYGRPEEKISATSYTVAAEGDFDLALLHCPNLTAPPVRFCDTPAQLGSEIRLLGYPLIDELGQSLKVTNGTIAAIPPHQGMMGSLAECREYLMYDALINPGNSGGPACNKLGEIMAVNTFILMSGAAGGGYAAGVPADKAAAYVGANLPEFDRNTIDSSGTMTWETAIQNVAASTVLILIYQDPDRVDIGDQFAGATGLNRDFDAYEDPWCMTCHGHGEVKCPNRDCMNGGVRSYRVVGATVNGATIMQKQPIRVTCGTCNGRSQVDCRNCSHGIDRNFH